MPERQAANIVFAFGPENALFFECDGKRYLHNIPGTLRDLYADATKRPGALERTLALALTSDGGYVVIFVTNNGLDKLASEKGPEELIGVMQRSRVTHNFELGTTRFAVGTDNGSYFFCGNEYGRDYSRYRWRGLPAEAEGLLQDRVAVGSHMGCVWGMTLGANGSYILWPRVSMDEEEWYHNGLPPKLEGCLKESGTFHNAVIALNPYVPDQYFCYFDDGSMRWNTDSHHFAAIRDIATEFAKSRSQEGSVGVK